MLTLEFRNALVNHPFSAGNVYRYTPFEQMNLRFRNDIGEVPFITTAIIGGRAVHASDRLIYCTDEQQFRGRLISRARLEEVMDSAHIPIILKMRSKRYLAGKGFLAHMDGSRIIPLLVACIREGERIDHIHQVKLYISRRVYADGHELIKPMIENMRLTHQGDVLLTGNLDSYLIRKLPLTNIGSLRERAKVLDAVYDMTVAKMQAAR